MKYILRVIPRAGHCWFETKVNMHLHNSSLSGTVGPCLTSLPSEEIVCLLRYCKCLQQDFKRSKSKLTCIYIIYIHIHTHIYIYKVYTQFKPTFMVMVFV